MVNLDLPWEPLFTQSRGEYAADASSLFAYWALAGTIGFTLAVHAFEAYLDARQRGSYQQTEFPSQLENIIKEIDVERQKEGKIKKPTVSAADQKDSKKAEDNKDSAEEESPNKTDTNKPLLPQLQEKFKSAQAYGMDKINFGMIPSMYDVTESVLFLILGFLPFIWEYSVELGQKMGWTEADNEINISLIFLGLTTIIGTITSLPFELYSTFSIEKKHGFNKMTLGLFFTDKIKSLLLTFVIGAPFLALLLHIIKVRRCEYFLLLNK